MPYKDPEEARKSNIRSYHKNKAKWKPTRDKWARENPEKIKKIQAKYLSNPENRKKRILTVKKWKEKMKDNTEYTTMVKKKKSEYQKRTREKFRIQTRDKKLQKRYGVTLEFVENYSKEVEGKCEICKATKITPRNPLGIVVDHNHTTGKFRGLLCNSCNRGIGYFRDNTELLKSAIKYLNKC